MSQLIAILRRTPEVLPIYWMLFRITVPITILAELASRVGLIEWMAPAFAPVMNLVGLPPELGLAWLTAMIVGMWGAVPLLFSLVGFATAAMVLGPTTHKGRRGANSSQQPGAEPELEPERLSILPPDGGG